MTTAIRLAKASMPAPHAPRRHQLDKRGPAPELGTAPILIQIETSAGHGAGKPTTKKVEEDVDLFSFLDLALGSPK